MAIWLKSVLLVSLVLIAAADQEGRLCSSSCSNGCKTYSTNCTALPGTMFETSFAAFRFATFTSDPDKWTVAVFNSSITCDASTAIMAYPIKCPINSCCSMNIKFDNGDFITSFVVLGDANPNGAPIMVEPYSIPKDNTMEIIGIVLGAVGVVLLVAALIVLIICRRRRTNYATV